MPKNQEFLTIQEFADCIRVNYFTIWRGIKNGHIQAFRVGSGKKSSYRIPKSEIGRMCLFDLEDTIKKIIDKGKS